MMYEDFEAVSDSSETKLSGFQNDVFVDDPMHKDLMPKIRFTTDANEAEEAAKADRSDPLHLPDSVFHVEPKEDSGEAGGAKKSSGFQNDSFGITVENHEETPSGDASGDFPADYCGPSSAALDIKIENAVKDLTFAQIQLEKAIENGTGVMTAMNLVESAEKLRDTYIQQHSKAVAAEARAAAERVTVAASESALDAKGSDEVRLGSVSHATWELEQAYKSDNSIRIDNAERNLAHEKAKEAAKK